MNKSLLKLKKRFTLFCIIFCIFYFNINVFASIKITSCNYNLVTFDLMYKTEFPPTQYESLLGLAIPDISLTHLRLILYNENCDTCCKDNLLKLLDLNQLISTYPIGNTYIENNIRFILIDQFKLLKALKKDKKDLKEFREKNKKLLEKFLEGTQIFNKYKQFIKTYKIKTNFYQLNNSVKLKSLKKAQLLQSSSPYKSIQLNNISTNNTRNEKDFIFTSSYNSDTFIQFIMEVIKFIKDNAWLVLGVLLYIYIMIIILKKR